ncbi:MAG: response regulator [Rhodospirillales bacterium]
MSDYGYAAEGLASGGNGYLRDVEILIAEDNDYARGLLRDILKVLGANRLHYCHDGQDALNTARHFDIDIALVDWHMPIMNGVQFTKTIRMASDSPNPFLPIIMISAFAGLEHVAEARDAGINEYLIKPYSARQLLTRITTVVERPRQFIRNDGYFGPDRRRIRDRLYTGIEKRKGPVTNGSSATSVA